MRFLPLMAFVPSLLLYAAASHAQTSAPVEIRGRTPATVRVIPGDARSVLWTVDTPAPAAECTSPCALSLSPGAYTLMGRTPNGRWRTETLLQLGPAGARVDLSHESALINGFGVGMQITGYAIAGAALVTLLAVSVASMECSHPVATACSALAETYRDTALVALAAGPLVIGGAVMRAMAFRGTRVTAHSGRRGPQVYGAVTPVPTGAAALVGVAF